MSTRNSISYRDETDRKYHLFHDRQDEAFCLEVVTPELHLLIDLPREFVRELSKSDLAAWLEPSAPNHRHK